MKLQILSDLHLEMVKPPYSWRIPESAAEVVVLAGDIGVGVMGVKWAVREAERFQKRAVYVPGNHEYYGERLNVLEKMRTVARGSRVSVLDLDEVMLEGVRFLGATLWTDYLAFGRDRRPDAMDKAARCLNDHRLSKVDLPRLRGHPEKHESAIGVEHGKWWQGQAANVFG